MSLAMKRAAAIDAASGLSACGLDLEDMLRLADDADAGRDANVAEIFSGVGSIKAAAEKRSFKAVSFDKLQDACQNVLVRSGLIQCVLLIASVVTGGLVWIAPDCSSFCGLCAGTSRRTTWNPLGDESLGFVAGGNQMGMTAVLLLLLAYARGCIPVLENPSGNFFWRLPCVEKLFNELPMRSVLCYRCSFTRPGPNHYKKAYKLASPDETVEAMASDCSCKCEHASLVTRSTDSKGKVRHTGKSKQLKESGAYPPAMGRFVIKCWQAGHASIHHNDDGAATSWKNALD